MEAIVQAARDALEVDEFQGMLARALASDPIRDALQRVVGELVTRYVTNIVGQLGRAPTAAEISIMQARLIAHMAGEPAIDVD